MRLECEYRVVMRMQATVIQHDLHEVARGGGWVHRAVSPPRGSAPDCSLPRDSGAGPRRLPGCRPRHPGAPLRGTDRRRALARFPGPDPRGQLGRDQGPAAISPSPQAQMSTPSRGSRARVRQAAPSEADVLMLPHTTGFQFGSQAHQRIEYRFERGRAHAQLVRSG